MATTYTPNARLQMPGTADRFWDAPLNANANTLDALTAIGSLAVTATEAPSATLNVRVTAGSYAMANGLIGSFAGATTFPVPASSSTFLWLTDAGVLTAGTAFPATAHVRLAQVVSTPTTIAQVADQRVQCATRGTGLGFVLKSGDTINGPLAIASPGTGTAVFSADPNQRLIGFFGVGPTTQAPSLTVLTDATTGTAGATIANVGTAFSQGALNNNFASLTAQVNALTAALKRHGLMST